MENDGTLDEAETVLHRLLKARKATMMEWAANWAHLVTDWREVERCAERGCDGGRWSMPKAIGLLGYRDQVAARLVEPERDVLCGRRDWGPASMAIAEALRGLGLHRWVPRDGGMRSELTDLGREVARVLGMEGSGSDG